MLSNVVHCRRERQITPLFLPPEPHEQYERAKMQGECSRKQTNRRRHAEVCWGVFRITPLGEGRRWELREKLGWGAATATFRERGQEGWLARYTPYPPATAAPRDGAWLWQGASHWLRPGGRGARPVAHGLLPSTRLTFFYINYFSGITGVKCQNKTLARHSTVL